MTSTLPARWYRDPEIWTRECTGIFAKTWQLLGHVSEFAETGAWRADTIAGWPLLVVRDEAGKLNGFHNVCRHRAGTLTDGDHGRCAGFLECRYHGWRYALDGRLRLARDFGSAPDFDPRQFSLYPLLVETWRSLVFVNADPNAAPLAELTAPLDTRLGAADWADMHVALRRHHHLSCNWKTYVENYLEGYHVPLMHPGLDAEIDSTKYEVRMENRIAVHEAPMRDKGAVYEGLWGWAWPNLGVNVYAKGLMLERITPLGLRETRLDYLYLMPAGETVSPDTMLMSDQVTAEDKWITERVQENLDAGIYESGRLSPKHEGGVAAFQAFVRETIGEG